ncbi:MAG TPA: N-acetyltransferase [Clostridia bacterium]|nr:N-acetyltransferase [Clostridia bacterium]
MQLRKAVIGDVPQIQNLINFYAEQGLMLARSLSSLYGGIREFIVAEKNARIIGVGALHIVWGDLAEIRSLAIAQDYVKNGLGSRIVQALVEEARQLGVPQVFTLTYQPGFFEKCGFHVIDKEELPNKVWKDCLDCVKFPNCDEIALLKKL